MFKVEIMLLIVVLCSLGDGYSAVLKIIRGTLKVRAINMINDMYSCRQKHFL